MHTKRTGILLAILAAVCYGISAPISKLLLDKLPPVLMASLLYLGAGIGMLIVRLLRQKQTHHKEAAVTRKELPYTIGMIALDIAAPILLLIGLSNTVSATASLMNNFEIVATAVIAFALFKEAIGKRMWIALVLITLASAILSVEDFTAFRFSIGALFISLACVCWGLENNCTRMLSLKDPLQIVIIKGFGSGLGSFIIAMILSEHSRDVGAIILALLLGFVAYGLSIFFYIHAQRHLGAARTSAYYAFAPFIGVGLSALIFQGSLTTAFMVALVPMAIGTCLVAFERHVHEHVHATMVHEHRHVHGDGHHDHPHRDSIDNEHSHLHGHQEKTHTHRHTPDLHHTHRH